MATAVVDNRNLEDKKAGAGGQRQQHMNGMSRRNRIQVSTKKQLFFYVNLSKRLLQQYEEVELSALGLAIATAVTVAEILKNNGLAVEKRIFTSTMDMRDNARRRSVQKIEISLQKSELFDELMAAAAEESEVAPPE
eukprot:TRINITY_DN2614_c0_g1_i5.p1 TRINITY_DN2614_c0_g1~~TRINITY_DN2614_c0_g1_i5.p1  ORF type:complete len:137 (+),score=28.85 TRINITY_DN2614_c0_g1_i5:209-619(+)